MPIFISLWRLYSFTTSNLTSRRINGLIEPANFLQLFVNFLEQILLLLLELDIGGGHGCCLASFLRREVLLATGAILGQRALQVRQALDQRVLQVAQRSSIRARLNQAVKHKEAEVVLDQDFKRLLLD